MKINLNDKTKKILKWAGYIGVTIATGIFSQSLNDDAAKEGAKRAAKEGFTTNPKK